MAEHPSSIPYVKHAHNAYCYRCSFGLTYPGCDLRCAKDVEELIQTTTNGEVAAFMAEPIQGWAASSCRLQSTLPKCFA